MSCPFSHQTSAALRRVFVQHKLQRPSVKPLSLPYRTARCQTTFYNPGSYAQGRAPNRGQQFQRGEPRYGRPPPPLQKPREYLPPRAQRVIDAPFDEEIGSPWMSVVDKDGTFHQEVRRSEALRMLKRDEGEHLVQTSPEGREGNPTCRIYTKQELKDMLAKRLAREKERKKAASSVKGLELNWAIGPADLEMKLNQFKKFLTEGRRVEVVFRKKRGSRPVEEAECRRLLLKIKGAAMGVEGKETSQPDGQVGQRMVLKFEGKKPKPKAAEAVAGDSKPSEPKAEQQVTGSKDDATTERNPTQ